METLSPAKAESEKWSRSPRDVRPVARHDAARDQVRSLATLDLRRGLVHLETTPLTAPKQQPELWPRRLHHAAAVVAKLRETNRPEFADLIAGCHTQRMVAQCTNCKTTRIFWNRCKKAWCPNCQPELARNRINNLEWWTKTLDQPKHVVLTLKNTPDLTRGHVAQIKKWIANLRRRKFARGWRSGIWAIECTNEKRGWHLHIHMLVDARWIGVDQLKLEWSTVNGGAGHIVHVTDARQKDYLREVAKYAVKGSQLAKWTGEQIAEYVAAFDGQRTFGVFGQLYGQRTHYREWIESLKERGRKCECGCAKWEIFSDADWIRHLTIIGLVKGCPTRPPPKRNVGYEIPMSHGQRQFDALLN